MNVLTPPVRFQLAGSERHITPTQPCFSQRSHVASKSTSQIGQLRSCHSTNYLLAVRCPPRMVENTVLEENAMQMQWIHNSIAGIV